MKPATLVVLPPALPIPRVSQRGWRALAALGGGALTGLSFVPLDFLAPLVFVGPLVCFLLWERDKQAAAFFHGWLFMVALLSVGGYWLYLTPQALAHLHSPLGELFTAAFVSAMSLYLGIAGSWFALAGRRLPLTVRALGLLPAVWVLAEWLRSWVLTGFPWFGLGYAVIDTPLAGWAPLFGSYGMSAAVAMTAGAVVILLRRPGPRPVGWALVALIGLWGGGALLRPIAWTHPASPPLRVALVQTYHKTRGMTKLDRWKWLVPMTRTLLRDHDAVIFPETVESLFMVEIDGETPQAYLADSHSLTKRLWSERSVAIDGVPRRFAVATYQEEALTGPLEQAARTEGRGLVLGVAVRDNQRYASYNSLLSLGGPTRVLYDKRHLVPFGERLPLSESLAPVWRWLRLRDPPFHPGRSHGNRLPVGRYQAGVSVCYESAFSREIREALPAARLLIMASNDGVFAGTIEPEQHQQVVRMRALETGRWVARANRVGVTAVTAADGSVVAQLPLYRYGVLTSQVVPLAGMTPYVRWGDGPMLLMMGMVLVGFSVAPGMALWKNRRAGTAATKGNPVSLSEES